MASTPTTSAFLQLPREIRDDIYRRLLTITLTLDAPGERYHLHPAILRASKQISSEAQMVLHNENDLVLFELDRLGSMDWAAIERIPHINKLRNNQQVPITALRIAIADRHPTVAGTAMDQPLRLLTGPEGIWPLIECFWQIGIRSDLFGVVPLHAKSITLTFLSRVLFKGAELQELLLQPFNHVQGFHPVSIQGANPAFAESLARQMTFGPTSDQAIDMIQNDVAAAEKMYRNGNYNETLARWDKLSIYRLWIVMQVTSPLYHADDFWETMQFPSQEACRMILGPVKALLHMGDYDRAVEMADDGLELEVVDLEPSARSVLMGKLDLIAGMAMQMITDPTLLDPSSFWDPLVLLQQGPRSAAALKDVLKEFFSAKEMYSEREWLRIFIDSKAFWDLIDNREEEGSQ